MAEAALTFVLEKLTNLLIGEANLLQGVDGEIKLLQSEMEWMRLFLENADAKRRFDPEVKLMVKQIREITFKAEDIIDEFLFKIHREGGSQRRTDHINWFTRSVKSIITCISSDIRRLPLRHELGNEIKVINTMTEKITANKSKYCIEGGFKNERNVMRTPIAEDQDVVGIEDSTKQVTTLLIGSGGGGGVRRRRRSVVSIVGMGGLGKTTLAKKVYNSKDVKEKFDCFAWVSVSQNYRLKDLLLSIIKCLTFTTLSTEESETLNEEELRNKICNFLKLGDKKYLIVLDDIWDIQAWNGLNTAFPDQMNCSRVLLTTRNRIVGMHAAAADSSSDNNIHALRFLDIQESWELFRHKVFAFGGVNSSAGVSKCPLDLEEVAKEMVGKCGGLPLAILVLGGLLSSKAKTPFEWSKVNKNLNWHLIHGGAAGSGSCLGILTLSYYDLPYYLKPIFLYFSLFPEDYEIPASLLFQCWIAEGFVVQSTRGGSSSSEETIEEDNAEDYLEELIHRSMIQVVRLRHDGRVKTCRVHDLLRDLAIAESKEDQFSQVISGSIGSISTKANNVRRLTIHCDQVDDAFDGIEKQQYFSQYCLRSLMVFTRRYNVERFLISLYGCFKLLKVLDVDCYGQGGGAIRIPEEIGELIHLKHLRFHGRAIRRVVIPNSFRKLVNLQTLNLECGFGDCVALQFLSFRKLRHLRIGIDHNKSHPTNCYLEIDSLTNLQSLSITFRSSGLTNIGRLDRLRMLKKLEIIYLPEHEETKVFTDIAELTVLRSLKLLVDGAFPAAALTQFSGNSYLTKLALSGRLLSSSSEFLFPPNLVKLSLGRSKIETDVIAPVLGELQNLEFLKLSWNSCIGKKMVVSEGGFLRLQVLKLEWLTELEELIVEDGALISLTHLKIEHCLELKMIPDGLRYLSKLEELNVVDMPEEFMCRLSSENEGEGEDWEKIKHIPSVIIEDSISKAYKGF